MRMMMRMMKWGAMGVGLMVLSACASEPARTAEGGGATRPTTGAMSAAEVEMLLSKIKADKKLLVASNMNLTDAEAAQFWPLYDSYQRNLEVINMRLGRTIADYAEAFKKGPLSEDTASRLLEEALVADESELALRQSFVERLGLVLPSTKVARYLQIENKIRSAVKFGLAREIPLVY